MAEFYDLPGAMLQSTQTGAALGQAMAHNYFQGQEQSLRMQQFQSERALRQLQERQASEMLDWTLRQHHQAIQDEANTQKANAVFQTLTTPVLQMPVMGPPSDEGQTSLGTAPVPNPMYEPDTGKAMIKAFGGTAKNPIEFGKLLMDAAMVNYHLSEADKYRAQAKAAGTSGVGTIQEIPSTIPDGQKFYAWTHPSGVPQLVQGTAPQVTTVGDRKGTIDPKGVFHPFATDVDARQTKQKLLAEALKVDPSQVDSNGNLTPEGWSSIQKQSQITTATRTAIEKQTTEGAKVFALGNQLADLLQPGTVGPLGNITRAYEGVASALNPNFKIGPATDAATVAMEFQGALTRGLKSDSNIAEAERKTIVGAMPKVDEWTKGVAVPRSRLAVLLQQWGTLSRNNAAIRGKPITKEWLTPQEIIQDYADGKLTKEETDALMQGNGWKLIEKLRQEALR